MPASLCDRVPMADPLPPATIDEALGLRAPEAVLDRDLDRVAAALAAARPRGSRQSPPEGRVEGPAATGRGLAPEDFVYNCII